jgi:hypothetical protein
MTLSIINLVIVSLTVIAQIIGGILMWRSCKSLKELENMMEGDNK